MRGHDELAFTVAASPMPVCALSVSKRYVLPDGSAAALLLDVQAAVSAEAQHGLEKVTMVSWHCNMNQSSNPLWEFADHTVPQALQSNTAHKNFVLIIMPSVKGSPGSNRLGTVFPAQS